MRFVKIASKVKTKSSRFIRLNGSKFLNAREVGKQNVSQAISQSAKHEETMNSGFMFSENSVYRKPHEYP